MIGSNVNVTKTDCEAICAMSALEWSWYEIAKDFSPTIATLLVAIFSIRFAISQLKQQHQNALDLQASTRKKEIQISLFEEIQERLDRCASLSEHLGTDMIFRSTFLRSGANPNHDEQGFIDELRKVLESITDVTVYIERYEVISPKLFRVARSALHSAHYDLLELVMATNMELAERFKAVSEAAGNACSYCHDLKVAIQNDAFGDLFESKAPIREPADPNEKVIVNEEEVLDELLHYFEHETPHGRSMDKVKQNAARRFEDQN